MCSGDGKGQCGNIRIHNIPLTYWQVIRCIEELNDLSSRNQYLEELLFALKNAYKEHWNGSTNWEWDQIKKVI